MNLYESPKYADLAFLSLTSLEGVPFAIILQFDRTIATSTQLSKSLAWWSQIHMLILLSVCKLTMSSCNILIVKTSKAAKHSSNKSIFGFPKSVKAITSFFFLTT